MTRFVHYSETPDLVLNVTKIDANAAGRAGLFVYPEGYETSGWTKRYRIEIECPSDAAELFQSFAPGEVTDEPDGFEEWFIPAARFGDVQIVEATR